MATISKDMVDKDKGEVNPVKLIRLFFSIRAKIRR
jgi:hypothetical protein